MIFMKTQSSVKQGQSLKNAARAARLALAILTLTTAFGLGNLRAANAIKLDTTSMLTNNVNWSGGSGAGGIVVPTQIGEFDATASSASLAGMSLGANIGFGGLKLDANMNGPLIIASGSTLTLSNSGIDMSVANQNATINCAISCGAIAQTWTVVAGKTLTLGSTVGFGGGGSLTLAGAGNFYMPSTSFSTGNGTGLIGVTTTGTVTANDVNIGKTGSTTTTVPTAASPIAASAGQGFFVSGAGAVVNLNTLELSTQNGGCSSLISAGSTTVTNAAVIGKSSSGTRAMYFQVSGGSFTVNDTNTGVSLAVNNGSNPNTAEFYVSGGTATVGKFTFGASTDTVGGNGVLIVKGGNFYVGSGGIVRATTIGAYNETITLFSGLMGATANWSSTQPITLSSTTSTPFTIAAGDAAGNPHNITLSGVISGASTAPLTVTNGGTLTLSGANTFTGIITNNGAILNAGVAEIVNVSGPFGKQLQGAAGTIVFGTGGTLQYSANNNFDYSGRFGTGNNQPISIDTAGRTVTFLQGLVGIGTTLTLTNSTGSGKLILSGVNNYTGATTNNGGILANNGSIAGNVVINSGGQLGGIGSVSGSVTINSGGGLSPGNSVGTITVGSLTLNSGSINNFEFNNNPANDQTIITTSGGFINNGGVFNLYQEGGTTAWTTPGTYNLIQYTGSVSGTGTDGSGNLNSDWTTASGANPHIGNPQPGNSYAFALSGGWLTLTIVSTVNSGSWGVDADGNWSLAGNWTAISGTMPPRNASDTATFGTGSTLRTVTLDANETVGTANFNNGNSFVIADAGNTLTLDNSGSGAAVNVTGGTANSIATAVSLNDNAAVNVSSGKALAISSTVSSTSTSKTLNVNGAGTLALSGNNTYGPAAGTVGTTLSGGGILQLGSANALGAGDLANTGSSTLQAGTALTVGNNIGISSGVTLAVDNSGANSLTLSGVISGGGGVSKTSNGTISLVGANVYSGGTAINNGVVIISSDGAAAGNAGNLGVVPASATADNIILNGGDLFASGTLALHANHGVGIGATTGTGNTTALFDAAGGQTLTVNGIIASAGNTGINSLTINGGGGGGTVILGSANTFNGTNVINAGTLQLANSLALQNSTLNYNNQGGTLSFGTLTAASFGNLMGLQNLSLLNNSSIAVALTVGGNNASTVYGGILSGAGASLTKNGAGTLTLTGNNSYTGFTAANAGTLELSTGGVINGAAISGQGYLVDGGSLTGTSANFNPVGNAFSETSGTANLGAVTGVANSDGILISITGGSFTASSLGLQRTFSQTTTPTVTAPVAAQTTSGFYVNGASANVSLGTLSIAVANSGSSASARVDAGTVTASGEVLIGQSANRWNILQINGGTFTSSDTANGIVINQNNAGAADDAELYLSGGVTTANKIGFGVSSDAANNIGLLIIKNGTLYVGSGGIVTNHPGDTVSIGLTSGLLGATTNWSSTVPMQLSGTATTPFTIQTADSIGTGHNISLGGALSGAGALNVTGTGTLTLGGVNTYTGATGVSNGTLVVNGSLAAASAVTVTNATLSGIGTIGGAATNQSYSILAPGTNGVGTLTFGGTLTLDPASTNSFAVTTVGGASNKVAVVGLLTPNTSVVSIKSGTALHGGTYNLFTYGTVSGAFNATPVFDVAPVHAASIVDNGSGLINLVVPNAAPVAGAAFTMNVTIGLPSTVKIVGGKNPPTDADGDALVITSVSGAVNGTVTTDGTNVTYTATNGTTDSFTYTVSDGNGGTASQTVSVVIAASSEGSNRLSIQSIGGGMVVLNYAGIPNYNYALDETSSLTPPVVWTPVVTNAAAANGSLTFTNTPGGTEFYRTRSVGQ
jgi:fibronectin-binding autotransporter adhesin